jgi:UDP-2-acetamido-3-amino-2,3-dideoxy-glucuronate N-acetyltransferase
VPLDPSVFVHERGLCESDEVGARTRIWAFAHVMRGSIVGSDCNIGEHCFIESGASIGNRVTVKNGVAVWDGVAIEDEVFVGPCAVFTNDRNPRVAFKKTREGFLSTRVERGSTIGANATIVCGLTIGEGAFIGAGAVVTADVPAYALMAGNPARRIGWTCACGERLSAELRCACGRQYSLAGGKRGLRIRIA